MASLDRVHNCCMCVMFMCGEAFEKLRAVLVYHFNHHINMFIKATKCFFFCFDLELQLFSLSFLQEFRLFLDVSVAMRLCSLVSAVDQQKNTY